MKIQEINLIGGGFQHSPSTSGYDPLYIKWIKNGTSAPITIYVDNGIFNNVNVNSKNYAWLCESKTIIPEIYNWCLNNIQILKQKYIKVFTHDITLCNISDIFVLVQCSGKSFLNSGQIYDKSKLISMVCSNKVLCAEHIYRLKVIDRFKDKCDLYGRGFNPINNKIDGLKDYCFSITMENATYSNMFTEKITDCFMCGTVPIYYGIPNICDFFDKDGIIVLNDNFDVKDISFDLYNSMLPAIKNNFKIANEMLTAEDYIYINYIKNYEI
jgi:hypothetical protein